MKRSIIAALCGALAVLLVVGVRHFAFPPPPSPFISDAAKQAAIDGPRSMLPHLLDMMSSDIQRRRETLDTDYMAPRIAEARKLYAVEIAAETIDGVYTETISPAGGVPPENAKRVLMNLHGGGFSLGARTEGQLESIPVAHIAQMKVIAVDYRQGPEHRFPAASEDVATVYRALLKSYTPQQIGIFGCSAGGILTAEAVAWFQKHDLPRPGAVGIFCASAGGIGEGDSRIITDAFRVPPLGSGRLDYFEGADMRDPLVSPVYSAEVLAQFPPTLIITATRDMAMSAALYTHQRLVASGVEADLHVFEGLSHYFFADTGLPESREAFAIMARFFQKHLAP